MSLIFVLLKIAMNPTVYKSVISKFFIQLYESGTVKPWSTSLNDAPLLGKFAC